MPILGALLPVFGLISLTHVLARELGGGATLMANLITPHTVGAAVTLPVVIWLARATLQGRRRSTAGSAPRGMGQPKSLTAETQGRREHL